jgi:hypothetical protein
MLIPILNDTEHYVIAVYILTSVANDIATVKLAIDQSL